MAEYRAVKLIRNGCEYCFPIGWWAASWNIDYLIVWWWWGGGSCGCWSCMWNGWWWGWEVICWNMEISGKVDITVWKWGVWGGKNGDIIRNNTTMDTEGKSSRIWGIVARWWASWNMRCQSRLMDGWKSGSWCVWWNSNCWKRWWGWGWAWWDWCTCNSNFYWWNWWNWLYWYWGG